MTILRVHSPNELEFKLELPTFKSEDFLLMEAEPTKLEQLELDSPEFELNEL